MAKLLFAKQQQQKQQKHEMIVTCYGVEEGVLDDTRHGPRDSAITLISIAPYVQSVRKKGEEEGALAPLWGGNKS